MVLAIIATAEASSNLARFISLVFDMVFVPRFAQFVKHITKLVKKVLGLEVKRRIMLGTYVLSRGFTTTRIIQKHKKFANLIRQDYLKFF